MGGTEVHSIDIRVIAATNEDLEAAVKQGKFRADLFYRLNVFPLNVPPLRERQDDIPLLARFFTEKYEALCATQTLGISDKAMSKLLHYQWPGNIRELENVIERSIILTENNQQISSMSLFLATPEPESNSAVDAQIGGLAPASIADSAMSSENWVDNIFEKGIPMDEVESVLVRKAMELSEGNVSLAARLLGMSRPAFAYRLTKVESH